MGGRLCTKAELCPGGTRLVVDGNIGGWTPVDESFQAVVDGCGNHPGGPPGWGTSSSNPYFNGVACCCPGASPLRRTSLAHSLCLCSAADKLTNNGNIGTDNPGTNIANWNTNQLSDQSANIRSHTVTYLESHILL